MSRMYKRIGEILVKKIKFSKIKRNTKKRTGHIQLFKYKLITIKRVIKTVKNQKHRIYYIYIDKKLLHKTPFKKRIQPIFNLLVSNY